jgi:hypothetical protein
MEDEYGLSKEMSGDNRISKEISKDINEEKAEVK